MLGDEQLRMQAFEQLELLPGVPCRRFGFTEPLARFVEQGPRGTRAFFACSLQAGCLRAKRRELAVERGGLLLLLAHRELLRCRVEANQYVTRGDVAAELQPRFDDG